MSFYHSFILHHQPLFSLVDSSRFNIINFNMAQLFSLVIIALIAVIASGVPIADEAANKCLVHCTWNGIPTGYGCPCGTQCCAACYGCTIYCCSRNNAGARNADALAQSIATNKDVTPIGNHDVIVKSS
jgi:hypothetical protein